MAFVYLLRCADGSLYCGWTTDVERRVAAHNTGRASRYTARRLPVELAVSWELESERARAQPRVAHQAAHAHAEAGARGRRPAAET